MNSLKTSPLAKLTAFIKNRFHSKSKKNKNKSPTNIPNTEAQRGNFMASSHVFSRQGIELLKSIERLATTPYDDQNGKDITSWVKGATIGYGHLISKDEWPQYKNGITESAADALFLNDLKPFSDTINNSVTSTVSQNEFDAMVIFAFNIGQRAFTESSALKLINNPNAVTNYNNLEEAWKAWNKSQGIISNGLKNRRESEWNIFSKGVYAAW